MIIYSSRTGNVKYITSKLDGIECINVNDVVEVDSDFILFTYTDGLGQVPKKVEEFMRQHYSRCKGVICSGNTNFGKAVFCKAGNIISKQYQIPLIRKVELRGFDSDYKHINEQYHVIMGGN